MNRRCYSAKWSLRQRLWQVHLFLVGWNNFMVSSKAGMVDASFLSFLVPSQVIQTSTTTPQSILTAILGDQSIIAPVSDQQVLVDLAGSRSRRARKKRPKKKKTSKTLSETQPQQSDDDVDPAMTTPSNTHSDEPIGISELPAPKFSGPKSGNLPDIYWRAVDMDHLRQHPRFQALPHTYDISSIDQLEDLRLFRQGSWQWDALHHGRCTTSQAVAALGFLEPVAGQLLGVPTYWQRGGMGAYHRLRQTPIRSLQDMNKVLVSSIEEERQLTLQEGASVVARQEQQDQSLWEPSSDSDDNAFDCRFLHSTSESETQKRKAFARKLCQNEISIKTIRMAWGNAQEATAILTALNYFAERDPGFFMKEAGMCGAGLDLNQTGSDLLIGASPDAILCHSDGSIEALEVKNHCPFVVPWAKKGKPVRNNHKFLAFDYPFDDNAKVFSHYIPQLMMEMLCLGPECKSVVTVRQTAINGALLLRLHRDDEWIDDMVFFLQRFQTNYVGQSTPPPRNFFWTDRDGDQEATARYRRFVNRTLEIRNQIEVIAHIPHEKIQRVSDAAPMFLD